MAIRGSQELAAAERELRAVTDAEDRARLTAQVKHLQAYVFSRVQPNCEHNPVEPCAPPDTRIDPETTAVNESRAARLTAENHLADLCHAVFEPYQPGASLRVSELFNEVRRKCSMFELPYDPAADQIGLAEVSGAYARAWLEGVVVVDHRFQLGRVEYTVSIGSREFPAAAALVRLRTADRQWIHASGPRINGTVEEIVAPSWLTSR